MRRRRRPKLEGAAGVTSSPDGDRAVDHAEAPTEAKQRSRLRAYYELTKPGISGYVMITAGVSAVVAGRGELALSTAVNVMLGTGLATAGALSLNQYVERDADAVMERTKGRPLPTGRLDPMPALAFGTALLMGGLVHLALTVGALPSMLTAASGLLYHGVYTPLKKHSFIATLTGAVPGALPMLIGWSAVTGAIDRGGLAMFAIGYLWQLPHVLGLAWMLRDDYARVGFKLVPPGGARAVAGLMVFSTTALVPVSWAPTLLGYTGLPYAMGASALGGAFVATAVAAARQLTETSARRVFLASLLYHPLLLGLMLFDSFRL